MEVARARVGDREADDQPVAARALEPLGGAVGEAAPAAVAVGAAWAARDGGSDAGPLARGRERWPGSIRGDLRGASSPLAPEAGDSEGSGLARGGAQQPGAGGRAEGPLRSESGEAAGSGGAGGGARSGESWGSRDSEASGDELEPFSQKGSSGAWCAAPSAWLALRLARPPPRSPSASLALGPLRLVTCGAATFVLQADRGGARVA